MMKRIISILLVALIFLSYSSYASEVTVKNDDDFLGLFLSLGIIEKNDMDTLTAEVSRIKFIDLILKCRGLGHLYSDDSVNNSPAAASGLNLDQINAFGSTLEDSLNLNNKSTSNLFSDLDGDEEYEKMLAIALELSIITKDDTNSKFRPYDSITFSEAIKMVVTVLGYNELAQCRGGYPTGYLAIAEENKLLKNIDNYESITLKSALQLLNNMFHCEVLQQTQFDDKRQYKDNGQTFLSKHLGIEYNTGIVTANKYTGISENDSLPNDIIAVDNVQYDMNNNEFSKYLGYNVKYYYSSDKSSGRKKMIYMYPTANNEILRIDSKNILKYSSNKLYYSDDDNSNEYVTVPKSAIIIYNNRVVETPYDGLFNIEDGNIELVDNDGDGNYEFIMINSYTNYVINAIDSDKKIIVDKYNTNKSLSIDDYEKVEFFDDKGATIVFSDLKEWDVVSALESLDKNVVRAYLSRKTISGVVSEIEENSEKNGYIHAVIGGKEYETVKILNLCVGNSGTYYTNINGRIVGFDKEKANGSIGFLTKLAISSKGFDAPLKGEIYTLENKKITVEFAKSVEIDGSTYNKYTTMLGVLKNGNDSFVETGVAYTLNSEGKVIKLDTPTIGNQESKDSLHIYYSIKEGVEPKGLQYKTSAETFGGKVNITYKTPIMLIPPDLNSDGYLSTNSLYLLNDEKYFFDAYSISQDEGYADLIVMRKNGSLVLNDDTAVTLVESITTSIKDDGSSGAKLYGMTNGKKTIVFADDYDRLSGISPGDIIRFGTNSDGDINQVVKVFDYKTKSLVQANPIGDFNAQFKLVYANVYSRVDTLLKITLKGITNGTNIASTVPYVDTENLGLNKGTVMVCEEKGGQIKIRVGSYTDINDYKRYPNSYSKVVAHFKYAVPQAVIVYK